MSREDNKVVYTERLLYHDVFTKELFVRKLLSG